MKYIEFLWALDVLSKYYPKFQSHEMCILANDIWKWCNNELPENSSTLVYLKSVFSSPNEALNAIWKEIQLMAGPYLNSN
jgi:hypothetical protein